MASLAQREDLAAKVQMIYVDPPYGIKYSSNFQPRVGQTNVGDADSDISRQAEVVKAYRDAWHLGVHSYLNYLRERLSIARQLLSDSGSIRSNRRGKRPSRPSTLRGDFWECQSREYNSVQDRDRYGI